MLLNSWVTPAPRLMAAHLHLAAGDLARYLTVLPNGIKCETAAGPFLEMYQAPQPPKCRSRRAWSI